MKNMITHPINNTEQLASALREYRRTQKISQQALATAAHVARRTITNAESAENVGLKEFCRIANALGYELALRPKAMVVYEELTTIFKDDN